MMDYVIGTLIVVVFTIGVLLIMSFLVNSIAKQFVGHYLFRIKIERGW